MPKIVNGHLEQWRKRVGSFAGKDLTVPFARALLQMDQPRWARVNNPEGKVVRYLHPSEDALMALIEGLITVAQQAEAERLLMSMAYRSGLKVEKLLDPELLKELQAEAA